jgi:hypothetical protein
MIARNRVVFWLAFVATFLSALRLRPLLPLLFHCACSLSMAGPSASSIDTLVSIDRLDSGLLRLMLVSLSLVG